MGAPCPNEAPTGMVDAVSGNHNGGIATPHYHCTPPGLRQWITKLVVDGKKKFLLWQKYDFGFGRSIKCRECIWSRLKSLSGMLSTIAAKNIGMCYKGLRGSTS